MKVVLAKPCWTYPKGRVESTYNRVWPPLELANCAAIFRRERHEVSIVDAQALGLSPDALAARCAGADLAVLTSTGLDRWQCPYNDAAPFVHAARALRRAVPLLVATGFHGTVAPEAVLRTTRVDAVIRGEPEGAVAEIAAGGDFREVDGVARLDGDAFVSTPDRAAVDLEMLPVPAFEMLDVDKYFYEVLGGDLLLLETTRGCPYKCAFCSKVMYGPQFRRKTAEQVRCEIDYALDRTGVKNVYFIDLEFTVARDLAVAVCEHLISRGSPVGWTCQTRADNVDAELLALMHKAGCRLIHLGVESGSTSVLEASGKAATKDDVYRGTRLIHEAGIETLAFFMFGLPGETGADREETIRFAIDLDPTYASFHFATPYPGSRLFEESGMTLGDDLAFPLVGPSENLDVLKSWVARAMRAFYLRPSYITRHVLKFSASHWLRQLRLFLSYIR